MPLSRADRIAAIDSLSSCGPHAKAQPPPPMAHAPMPMGVICKSLLPRFLVIGTIIATDLASPPRICQSFVPRFVITVGGMNRPIVLCAVYQALLVLPVWCQTPKTPPAKSTMRQEIMAVFDGAARRASALAEAMPQEKFAWKP